MAHGTPARSLRYVLRLVSPALLVIFILAGVLAIPLLQAQGEGAAPLATTATQISPAGQTVPLSGTTSVDILISDVADLYGADVRLTFDVTILRVLDADLSRPGTQVTLGPLLTSGEGGYFTVVNSANNSSGVISLALTQLNPSEPVTGSGVLGTINLLAVGPGTSAMHFTGATLSSRNGMVITTTLRDGSVTVGGGATATPTATGAATATPSATPSQTATAQSTATHTATATASSTGTATQTATATASSTGTATQMATATISPTGTATASPSPSGTATAAPSATQTGTATHTPTVTQTPGASYTATASASAMPSGSATPSATATGSATPSVTPSATTPATASATATSSASPTSTTTASATPSAQPTGTATTEASATSTATPTATFTGAVTATGTAQASATASGTATASATASHTPTATATIESSTASCGSIVYGSTAGRRNYFSVYPSCYVGDESGPERLYQVTTAAHGDISASLSNLDADLDVFILMAPQAGACLAYGDNVASARNLPAGTYYIAVDGFQGAAGNFRLAVGCAAATATPVPTGQIGVLRAVFPVIVRNAPAPTASPTRTGAPTAATPPAPPTRTATAPALSPTATVAPGGFSGPNALVLDRDRNALYVVARDSNELVKLSLNTLQVVQRVAVGNAPYGAAMIGDRIYVANFGAGTVTQVDTDSFTRLPPDIEVGGQPSWVATDYGSGRIYVTLHSGNGVAVLLGNTVWRVLGTGRGAFAVAVDAPGRRAYVGNRDDMTVSVIAIDDDQVVQTIAVGGSPFSMAVNETTGALYVLHGGPRGGCPAAWLAVFSRAGALLKDVPVGDTCDGGWVVVNQANGRIYLAATAANQVWALAADESTRAVWTAADGVGRSPFGLAVNPVSANVYIGNKADNTIIVIGDPAR